MKRHAVVLSKGSIPPYLSLALSAATPLRAILAGVSGADEAA